MKTEPLTKEELAWMRALEKLLLNPPSTRLGFYTVGDSNLTAYDRSREAEVLAELDRVSNGGDFCVAVTKCVAGLGSVDSACLIHSTAG